jgi:hypothetical protein
MRRFRRPQSRTGEVHPLPHRSPQQPVAAAVGGEESRAAPRSHGLQKPALQERTEEAHHLRHALTGREARSDPGLVQVDDDALDGAVSLADQEILDVEVGVAAALVVEAAHRATHRLRGAQQSGRIRPGLEKGQGVDRVGLEIGTDHRGPEGPCDPPSHREGRPWHRCAGLPQRRRHPQLAKRPPHPEEDRAEQRAEQAAVKEAAQHQLLGRSRKLDQRGFTATRGTAAAREEPIHSLRGVQRERTDGLLEPGVDGQKDPILRETAKPGRELLRFPHGGRGTAVESR